MNTRQKEPQGEPGSDIELLLPWHAAGTLNRRDAARVEQALANDNDLAARYELVREELGEAIRLNESLGAPSARAMQALFAKIDAEPARKPTASFNLAARWTQFIAGFSPRTLAYGSIAAALAIVLQAGLIAGVVMKDQAAPQLASHGQQGSGSFVLVQFKASATAAEIGNFLRENRASIVGGPAASMFTLKVSDGTLSQAELGEAVRRIQANTAVVERALPGTARQP